MIDKKQLEYSVGGLLYIPAIRPVVPKKLVEYPGMTAIALCLEDSIQDSALDAAERQLKETLSSFRNVGKRPLLFVRVRTPEHLQHVHNLLGRNEELLTGYVLPKFDMNNGEEYISLMRSYNSHRECQLFFMPTLESKMIAERLCREQVLSDIKTILDGVQDLVLNIRVGGNDFTNIYGLRRAVDQTIYDIGVGRDILVDIINVFSMDYVVSGPVWEYFGTGSDGPWALGLRRELELDRLNGFIGKTAVHPTQLPLIYQSLKVSRSDYEDAKSILGWSEDQFAVGKSVDQSRMNEIKCHTKWAQKTLTLAQLYGILEEGQVAESV